MSILAFILCAVAGILFWKRKKTAGLVAIVTAVVLASVTFLTKS